MKTYDVTVTRDGKWWMVEIPEIDGLTQARRLEEAEAMARDYIAVDQDVALSEVAVTVTSLVVDGQDVLAAKGIAAGLREQARVLEETALAFSRRIAEQLTSAKIPVRDVSDILGVSHQRVSQIVSPAAAASKRAGDAEGVSMADAVLKGKQLPGFKIVSPVGKSLVVEVKSTAAPKTGAAVDKTRRATTAGAQDLGRKRARSDRYVVKSTAAKSPTPSASTSSRRAAANKKTAASKSSGATKKAG